MAAPSPAWAEGFRDEATRFRSGPRCARTLNAVDAEAFRDWLDRYFAAWASNDPDDVAALFADGAVYWYGPFREPTRGREAIVGRWVEGGPGEGFEFAFEPLAVTGRRGIAHWQVSFRDAERAARTELDGILVLDFDEEGRCAEHREWYLRRETPKEDT
jgi:hypothetical protein